MKHPASVIKAFVGLMFCLLVGTSATTHPGSGIVIDGYGQIYFTDTGKGVWKIDTNGKLIYLPASRFHWLTLDATGQFAGSPKNFGEYFERVTPQNNKPAIIMSSDFPLVAGKDGNIYYAYTRPGSGKIIRRTPDGKESVLVSHKIVESITDMTVGTDGSLYFTESNNPNGNTIRKITMNGTMSTIATFVGKNRNDLPLETTPSYCRGLAVDSKGTIYVAATGSRSVIKISPDGVINNILQESGPWTATGVAVFHGEVYVLEWHDVTAENLEVRTAYIPRVRKIGFDGKVTTITTVSR